MKKTSAAISAAILFAALSITGLDAQDYVAPPVTISSEKVKMDGKLFYSHVVVERQTLYSISKAYGVSIDEIYSANPSLKETGLKKNAIILIPVKADTPSVQERKAAKEEKKAAKDSRKRNRKNQKDYFIHTVKWYEDLDMISGKYGVPVDVIMEVNSLEGRKLKNRQQLRIPTNPESYKDLKADAGDSSRTDTSKTSAPLPPSPATYQFPTAGEVDAILMLPFDAQGEAPSQISMDFYCGVLLAARDLGKEGINIDLSVYDTYGDILPVTAERLDESDFVIGPPDMRGLSGLMDKCPEDTYVISPLDTRTAPLTSTHSNFIQVPTSHMAQYEDLLTWINDDRQPSDSTIIIYEKGHKNLQMESEFKKLIGKTGLKHSSFSYSILEGRDILDSLCTGMTLEGVNRVLVASESEAFVNDVVRNLNLLIHNKYDIVLYGPSKIRSYETIDIANLHNANLHSSLPYYIDYDDPKVRDFLLKYRALYNAEPSQMAFQGYDIMYYFGKMCSQYGEGWADKLSAQKQAMLMSDFIFEKTGRGYSRDTVRRVIYGKDYSVTLVEK